MPGEDTDVRTAPRFSTRAYAAGLTGRIKADYVGVLSPTKPRQLRTALQIAFDIDDDSETGISTE
jgi:hypothetical protein